MGDAGETRGSGESPKCAVMFNVLAAEAAIVFFTLAGYVPYMRRHLRPVVLQRSSA